MQIFSSLFDLNVIPEHLLFSVMKKMWLKEHLRMRRTCREMKCFLEEIEGKLNLYSRLDLIIQVEDVTLDGEVLVGAYLCEMPSFCRPVHLFNNPEEIPPFIQFKSIRVMDSCNPVRDIPMSVYSLPKLLKSLKLKCTKLRINLRSQNEAVWQLLKSVKFGRLHLSVPGIDDRTLSSRVLQKCSKISMNSVDKLPLNYADLRGFSSVKFLYAPPTAPLNQMFGAFLEDYLFPGHPGNLKYLRVPSKATPEGRIPLLEQQFLTKIYDGHIYQAYQFKHNEHHRCLWAYQSPCLLYQLKTADGSLILVASAKDNFVAKEASFYFSIYRASSPEEFLLALADFIFGRCLLFDLSDFVQKFLSCDIDQYGNLIRGYVDNCRGYLDRVNS